MTAQYRSPDEDGPPRLAGTEPHERASAIVELARQKARGAWQSIEPYERDESSLVRGAVAFARARLRPGPPDLTPLLDLLLSRREDDVAFALQSLSSLGDRAVPALAARASSQRTGRAKLLRALSELDSPSARAALAAAAGSTDTDLARRARALLSND